MKKTIAIIISVVSVMMANAKESHDVFPFGVISCIGIVESNLNPNAIGDNGEAVGALQIHKEYVDDVNRILGYKAYTYDDRKDTTKSYMMAYVYLVHYGRRYKKLTGEDPTPVVYARIHNGGPNGWKKDATIEYGKKFMSVYNASHTKSQK